MQGINKSDKRKRAETIDLESWPVLSERYGNHALKIAFSRP